MHKQLPDEGHVAKHIKRRMFIRDQSDRNKVIGCIPDAFLLRLDRTPPERYLSAAYLEHIAGTQIEQLTAIAEGMKASGFDLGKGGFAVGCVGDIKRTCEPAQVRIESNPKPKRPSYTEVWGVPQDQLELLVNLGTAVWCDVTLVDELPIR